MPTAPALSIWKARSATFAIPAFWIRTCLSGHPGTNLYAYDTSSGITVISICHPSWAVDNRV